MSKTGERKRLAKERFDNKKFYTCRSLFGYNDVYFYLLLGGRDIGKSYTVMDRFLRDWKTHGIPFYWLRLTDKVAQAMLQNNAAKLVDADLRRKYNLDLVVKGPEVFDRQVDGTLIKVAEVMGISTFYNMKGTATFDCEWKKGYNICCDEVMRDVNEPVRFDIPYSLVNTLENYVRDTKEKLRIVFICNYTETVGDILNLFNFIPEKFGRYHLAAKKAVIDYLPNTAAYTERRQGTVADVLMPNASTFTNQKVFDKTLLYGGKLYKPSIIVDFGSPDEIYTLWQADPSSGVGNLVVKQYNKEKLDSVIAMRPYIDGRTYDGIRMKNVINAFDKRGFKFRDLITQQRFTQSLSKVRKTK